MSSYSIQSKLLNSNKVFILLKSEIEKRLDPLYYSKNVFSFLNATKHNVRPLYELVNYTIAGFGVGKEEQDLTEKGYIQIRPTNLDEFGLLKFNRNVYLGKDYLETKKTNIIQKNDILFNNTNSQDLVGKTAFFDLEGIYFHSNHITRISVNEEKILPKFLWILLNIYQQRKIFYTICTNWNNQSGVGLELLNSLKILVPKIEVQKQIISLHENSLLQKKQNEAEAEKLLASIDDYLLEELGIDLPTNTINSFKERIFKTNLSNLSGDRFDPNYYSPDYHFIKESISKKFGYNKLKDIVLDIYRYPTFFGINYLEKGIPIIKGENIDKYGNIIENQLFDYIDDETHNKFNRTKLSEGDLVFTVRGLIGKVGFFTGFSGEGNINANVIKIRLSDLVNNKFYWFYLNSMVGQKLINQKLSGSVQPTITVPDILDIQIPIPPLTKQKEIADHISTIRQQAQQLKDNTKEILAQANKEIEKILLG